MAHTACSAPQSSCAAFVAAALDFQVIPWLGGARLGPWSELRCRVFCEVCACTATRAVAGCVVFFDSTLEHALNRGTDDAKRVHVLVASNGEYAGYSGVTAASSKCIWWVRSGRAVY